MSGQSANPLGPIVSRRRLTATAAAGSAALFLAACGASDSGDDEPETADSDLLNGILAAELALEPLAEGTAAEQASRNVADLTAAIERLGGTPASEPAPDPGSADDAEGAALDAALGAVSELDDGDSRKLVYTIVTGHAAQLAAVAVESGNDPAPSAFVLGATA